MAIKAIASAQLAELMASDRLYAVFDVRERGEYNEEQIPNTTSLPRSQIEMRLARLVPNRSIAIVVYDEGALRAVRAAETMTSLGYRDVAVLAGGLQAWRAESRRTVSGVNVPSKAFGEIVHHERHIPDITPEQLHEWQAEGRPLTILDMRTPEEYGRFCIPGGRNVPGGDVIHWLEILRREQAEKTVIINCAGRTRSIIGTAGLKRLGLNKVYALRNGTMGWVLAGFELERNPQSQSLPVPREFAESARSLAEKIRTEEKISTLDCSGVQRLVKGYTEEGVCYFIDVRSEREFEAGHLPGAINLPGGQAVQRADDFIPVRNGKIVFISEEGCRAVMAAYWYGQMGFNDVHILEGGLNAWRQAGLTVLQGGDLGEPLGLEDARRQVRFVTVAELSSSLQRSATLVLDVGSSADYESGHLPRAQWLPRGWLDIKAADFVPTKNSAMVVTCVDGQQSTFAARDLQAIGYSNVSVLAGGVRAWTAAGNIMETGQTHCLAEANDIVLSPSIRGTKEDMQRYLSWELTLTESK